MYDFPLRGPFSVCIFGMVLYSDSWPYIPSSSFLAQPEFISFDTRLSEETFKSSSYFILSNRSPGGLDGQFVRGSHEAPCPCS